eukprot:gene33454-56143_t
MLERDGERLKSAQEKLDQLRQMRREGTLPGGLDARFYSNQFGGVDLGQAAAKMQVTNPHTMSGALRTLKNFAGKEQAAKGEDLTKPLASSTLM